MHRIRPALKCGYLLGAQDNAVTPDVGNVRPSVVQGARDKKKAVTLRGVLFAAQNGHPEPLSPVEEPVQAGLEQIRLGHPSVMNMAVRVVELLPLGTSPQFLPEEEIPDARLSQAVSQILTVELRVVPRIGRGTHIRHYLDPVLFEKRHQIIEGVIRVADRQ